jgi:D-beta-D-heptose 7-phosphate kinase/D-beta-D-heptose 1-phosphate adenosyltransferase
MKATPFVDPQAGCVLVVGDFMLDRTVYGTVSGTCPEAPVVVLRPVRSESRPGGAGAVAQLLYGLETGIEVTVAGVLGDDVHARELQVIFEEQSADISPLLMEASRSTTVKERFIGQTSGRHAQQVLRIDYESTEDISADVMDKLWARMVDRIPDSDVVLISDYGKGVCTPELVSRVLATCREYGVPTVVDPARRRDVSRYAGADILKPNRIWLETVMGVSIEDVYDASEALPQLRQKLGWHKERLLVTLDRDGMLIDEPGHELVHLPAHIRQVYDVTGAGDMAQAVLGAGLARGLGLSDAAEWAVTAAGLEVERDGIVPVGWHEIEAARFPSRTVDSKIVTRQVAKEQACAARRHGRTVVFANGCFDLLHMGHIRLLQQAAALGDLLVVAINSDASVYRIKGDGRPIVPQEHRAELLAALTCVDLIVVFDDETPVPLLKLLKPDVLVKGDEYSLEQVVGWEVVTSYGGRIITVPMIPDLSTTKVVEECRRRGIAPITWSEQTMFVESHSSKFAPIST